LFVCWNFRIKLLLLYCNEWHFKNKLALSLPIFFLQFLLKIHFKTFKQIPHNQWFKDIGYKKCTSIWPLRTMDQQLERMTLGTQNLATRNKQTIIFRYDLILCIEEKDDIYENSEFTCFCKILRNRKILQVWLLIN
jgi:hypothetical protein